MREVITDREHDEADLESVEQGAEAKPLPKRNPQQQNKHRTDLQHETDRNSGLARNPLVKHIPCRQAEFGGEEHADAERKQG